MKTAKKPDPLLEELNRELALLPPCPPPISTRSGCKVMWKTYATQQDASIASQHARAIARYKEQLGYDFGYQSPGAMHDVGDGWEVTFP